MKRLWKGNLALAEGAIAGGLEAYFGYPITPQNEIPEYMSRRMREEGRIFLQAESEPASINMVFGAALTGKKAMTTSSSPGISLMQEGISYLAGCELPAVIANIQRGGPGLGNIAGAQGDYFQSVKGGGHGDYYMPVYTPATVEEMYTMTRDSFETAIEFRTPVLILSDGVLGQMMEPAEIPPPPELSREIKDYGWNLTGTRGREPRFVRSLMMEEGQLEEHNYKLRDKFRKMEDLAEWEEKGTEDAEIIFIGYGTGSRIMHDAWSLLRNRGVRAGFFRLKTVWPFPGKRIAELSEKAKFLTVELSLGQLVEDVRLHAGNDVGFCGRPAGGLPEIKVIIQEAERMLR